MSWSNAPILIHRIFSSESIVLQNKRYREGNKIKCSIGRWKNRENLISWGFEGDNDIRY